MNSQKNRLWIIFGGLLFLIAISLFAIQVGFLILQDRLQMEYIDNRLFYLINILIVICLLLGSMLLFAFTKRFKTIGASIVGIFIIINIVLLFQSNTEIKNIISISPDYKHVFSIKNDLNLDEAIYYRSYYGIVARPKEKIATAVRDDYDVEWLTNDIAAFTYETKENKVQAFVGTYGDRNQGLGYYNVGPEIQGVWETEYVKVVSDPEGILITEDGDKSMFEWDEIEQFGTLAIVLEKNQEAAWVIGLNENFEVQSDSLAQQTGRISLYKTTSKELYRLNYKPDKE